MPKATVELDLPELQQSVDTSTRTTVVMVVDFQYESTHPEGFRYKGPEDAEAVQATVPLVDRARMHGLPIIWVKSVRTPDQPIFSVYGHPVYRQEGTWNVEIAEPLKPLPGEPMVKKRTHDCFLNTRMESVLDELGIVSPVWSVIVVGVSLASCVLAAVTGLSNRDYRVLLPMDCTAPTTGPRAAMALAMLGGSTYSYNVVPLVSSESINFVTPSGPPDA